jgi:hypothetical protein
MCDLTKAIIRKVRSLDLLYLNPVGCRKRSTTSSWATDWLCMSVMETKIMIKAVQGLKKCTSFRLHESSSSEVLRVEGLSLCIITHIQGSTETPSEIVAQTYYDWPRKISDAFMDCCRNRLQISTKDSNTTSNKIQWAYLITMWTDTGQVSPRKKEEIRRTLEITTKFQNLRFSLGVTASEALAYRNCCIIQDRLNRLRIAEVLISWLENLSSTPNAFPDARAWSSIRKTNSLSLSLLVQRWKNRRKIESDFILAMARIAFHKLRFMSCSSGLIGLAPENAMAGDQICLLRGCTKPFILRRVVPPTMPNQDSASA